MPNSRFATAVPLSFSTRSLLQVMLSTTPVNYRSLLSSTVHSSLRLLTCFLYYMRRPRSRNRSLRAAAAAAAAAGTAAAAGAIDCSGSDHDVDDAGAERSLIRCVATGGGLDADHCTSLQDISCWQRA